MTLVSIFSSGRRREFATRRSIAAVLLFVLGLFSSFAQANALEEFTRAIATDDHAKVTSLLKRGMDPNTVNEKGEAWLLAAARENGPDVVKALVQARARVNIKNQYGDTPIMLAALRGNVPIVKLLRQAGAEINQQGWTPLQYAALNGHNEVIEYLLSAGADLALTAPNGATPVMLAVLGKKPATVKLLISYGFDVNAKNEKGETALAMAKRQQSEDLETILRQGGAR